MTVAALGLEISGIASVDKGTASLTKLTGAAKAAQNAAQGVATANRGAAATAAAVASSSNAAAASMNKQAGAANQVANSMRVANDNSLRMGGSMSGIAAQFQDIGVTAAMGMNPVMIALQQGTQIAGQMEMAIQSGGSAVGVLGQAFKSLFSPLTFITIALTALGAAGLQMVDWTGLAQSALRGVANNLQAIAPYAAAAAVGIALLYAPAILGGLAAIPAALYAIETGMLAVLATIGWPALLIAGIIALGGVAVAFRNDITKYLGVDIVGAAKTGANFLIASFMVAWERIKTTWQQLPNMIEAALTAGKNLFTSGTENAAADRVKEAYASIDVSGMANRDWLGDLGTGISGVATSVTSTLKGWADGLDDVDKKAAKAAERAKANYAEIVLGANQFVQAQTLEANAFGMTQGAAARLRHEQELLHKVQNDNIVLNPAQVAELNSLAAAMANAEMRTAGLRLAMENRGPFEAMRLELASIDEMYRAGGLNAQEYATAVQQSMASAHVATAGYASDFMGIMGQLFEDNKAVAIASAIVSTYQGVAKAIAHYPPPFSYAMAAAQLALGMKQVTSIKSTSKSSKSASGGGSGGAGSSVGSGSTASTAPETPAAPGASVIVQLGNQRATRAEMEAFVRDLAGLLKDNGGQGIKEIILAA